jgi:hypothetical protein
VGNDERHIRPGRNSSAEIAAKTGPLTDGEVMREVQQPGDLAGVVWAITWVMVLRSDPLPKQEVNADRSRECSVFFAPRHGTTDRRKIQRR